MDQSIIVEVNPVNSKPCISKVHVGLRNVKPEAYEPVLVSIGPYHEANPDLQAMQQRKNMYLNSLLEGRTDRREIYREKLKEFDSEARKCYVDPYPVYSKDEFGEMMLLDSCFIVEFFRKKDKVVDFDEDDPISRMQWMRGQIQSDMMLLENQLPYFILSKVYNLTKSEGEKSLEEMVMSSFNLMLPRPRLYSNNVVEKIDTGKINHLLHLVHFLCHRLNPLPKTPTISTVRMTCFSFFCERIIAKNRDVEGRSGDQTSCPLLLQNNNSGSDKCYKMKNQMGTVVELQEAGVKFQKVGEIYDGRLLPETGNYVSLFDIAFECGVMKVPCFKVDDGTEILLRNLIAYEQHFPKHFPTDRPRYFTDFACLMNQLINSKEDAKVLRFKKIIMNFLGDDDELSQLFNRLTDGVCNSYKPYDHDVRQKVDEHCKTPCNTWMAYFNRKYFKNPWAGISTFAAVFLLLLTVVQTVVALITWLA